MSTSTLPFELRVHSLESRIFGTRTEEYATRTPGPRSIQARLRDIEEALERASQGSDALKRLLDGYQQYLPLLSLNDAGRQAIDAEGDGVTESDLLPDSTKLTMVLEAARDIKDAERGLRDIEILKKQGAEGAGSLEELLPYKGDLIQGLGGAQARSTELRQSRREVTDLLRRYHDFTSVVSDLFLDLHHRIEMMDAVVAKQESKKRREQASHY